MKTKLCSKLWPVGARWLTAVALLAGACILPAQTVLQGLVAYLNFDDNIAAQAGTTNNGAIYPQSANPTARYVPGIIGDAVNFANSGLSGQPDDWAITLGKIESVYSNSFSFSIWVQTSSTVNAALFGNKDWTSGANLGWCCTTASGDNLNWNAAGGTRRDINLNPPFSDGNWHLTTVTWDRGANVVSIYVDGALRTKSNISPNGSASMNAGFPTLIGSSGSGKYSTAGTVDDLGIWTRVLAPEEIAAVYARGTNGLPLVNSSAPFFVQQPVGGTRYASDFFKLSCVLADDRGPVTYQWYQGLNQVSGATNSSLLLTNLVAGNFNYSVVANDGVGNLTSAAAVLTVLSSSQITNALAVYLNFDDNILAQGPTTISGNPIGYDPTPKYTSGQIGHAVTFANDGSSTYTPTDWAVELGDIEYLYTNNWSFSLWVNLTNELDGALFGNKDWTSGSDVGWVFAPYNATEINYYSATGPRRDLGGVNVIDGNWHHVAAVFNRDANSCFVYIDGNQVAAASIGATGFESLTSTLQIPNDTLVGSSGPGTYSGAGNVDDLGVWTRSLTAAEVLAIYAQGLSGQPLTTAVAGTAVRPSISSQPQSVTVFENRNAKLSVTAAGSAPLSYQWYQNGTQLANATNSILRFTPASTNNSGSYVVAVRNTVGGVTSAPPAIVAILPVTNIVSGLTVYLNFDN
ncbi:MAG: LamG-like jellyroll fold domain-containing protein, partial [Limisphaerales bacterium]